jgi:Phosphoesterase family
MSKSINGFLVVVAPLGFLVVGFTLWRAILGYSAQYAMSFAFPAAPDVQVKHVFIVIEENHNYSSVIGNASMPYLNRLASTYAYARDYYANTHPSIGNYFMLTAGQIITNNDSFGGTVSADNIVRHLIAAGKTWKEYSEALPSVGYYGGDTGDYTQHHNPLSYFSDVRSSRAEQQNLVPFTQFAIDLAHNTFSDYSFIVPDNDDRLVPRATLEIPGRHGPVPGRNLLACIAPNRAWAKGVSLGTGSNRYCGPNRYVNPLPSPPIGENATEWVP